MGKQVRNFGETLRGVLKEQHVGGLTFSGVAELSDCSDLRFVCEFAMFVWLLARGASLAFSECLSTVTMVASALLLPSFWKSPSNETCFSVLVPYGSYVLVRLAS